ncbi:tetratricopeptide repeat protein [Patescibacteria group bacterium]|nr:tetratricopeptide repeat protein [Patescibacteria group bacterium]
MTPKESLRDPTGQARNRAKETRKGKVFSFKDFPEVGLIFSVIFWVVLFGFLFSYFNIAKFYLADTHYKNYLANPSQNLERLERAAKLADSRTLYHIALARAYLQKFTAEVTKPQPNNQVITNMVALAVQEGKRAQELSPNRIAAQETLGVVYRDIQGMAQGALDWGIRTFEKAIELEPKNPVLLTELGKLQVVNNKLGEARGLFNRALELRPDYADAGIQLSILEEREGKTEEAIARLENLVQQIPFSVEAHFQLGRLYYNAQDYDKAILQFQMALQLFPNHSNSLYSLGLIYERKGERENALVMFERVLILNPGNEDVMRKIEELKE